MTSLITTTTTTTNNENKAKNNKTMAETTATSAMPAAAEAKADAPPLEQNISYAAERIIGNGSFGVVFEAKVVETGDVVAIKKVLQDKRFKNRELQIMRQLVKDPHPNIVALKHCFYSQVCCGLNFIGIIMKGGSWSDFIVFFVANLITG